MKSIYTAPYSYKQTSLKNDLENYLTELFAGVLNKDHTFFLGFMKMIGIDPEPEAMPQIKTQTSYPVSGKTVRPDLEIRIGNRVIILFENKIEASEREGQLDDYSKVLKNESEYEQKHLVYLTKYRESKTLLYEDIDFHQLIWTDVYDLGLTCGILAKELAYFIEDKNINMSGNISHLDALIIENLGEVIAKLDSILDSAHNYHKSQEGLGVRLDGGRSRGLIVRYGYYIYGKWKDGLEIVMGFSDPPVKVMYKIQGTSINDTLSKKLESKGWDTIRSIDLEQMSKEKKLSEFMAENGDEVQRIIEYFREAIDELKEVQ